MERLRSSVVAQSESMSMLKQLACEVFRCKRNRTSIQRCRNSLDSMENRIVSAQSTQIMSNSFRATTQAMAQISNEVNPASSRTWMMHFQRFNDELSDFNSNLEEVSEDANNDENEEANESDDPSSLIERIMVESGISTDAEFPAVPHQSIAKRVDALKSAA